MHKIIWGLQLDSLISLKLIVCKGSLIYLYSWIKNFKISVIVINEIPETTVSDIISLIHISVSENYVYTFKIYEKLKNYIPI